MALRFRLNVVDIFFHRITGIDLVLNTIDGRHDDCGKGEVGVATRVRATKLDPSRLGTGASHWNAASSGAVSLRVAQVYRGIEFVDETLEAVGCRIGER